MQIQSEIIINASTAKVWEVFTDFESYPSWNPFIKRLEGNPEVGRKIQAWLPQMKFTPTVKQFEKEKAFTWLGHLFIKGLFDGHHQFYLEPLPDGTTRFIQKENFSGILVPLFKNMLLNDTTPGFEKMNLALKERVESLQ